MRANRTIRDAHDQAEQEWLARIADFVINGDRSSIEQIISQHRGGQSCKLIQQIDGGFNYCLKARFDDDGKEWILRFPKPGCTMRPAEKVQSEFAVMRFIAQCTSIPIPKAIAYGIVEGEFSWLGPYIIMEAIEGEPLNGLILDEADKIRSDISDATMKKIYRQIADVLLELNSHTFNKVGSLHLHENNGKDVWTVRQKPMTMKSNEIERMGGLTSDDLIRGPFKSTSKYLNALADQSLYYLEENPMSSDTAQEAASDYNSIHILKAAINASEDIMDTDYEFRLFKDDMRFGNILVDKEFNIVGLIDWEFCYSGPAIFHQSPPWWIIGRDPFEWNDEDAKNYSERLGILLSFIKDEERRRGCGSTLSTRMQQFWANGAFWLTAALREYRFLEETMVQARKGGYFETVQVHTQEDSETFGERKMSQRSRYEVEVLAITDDKRGED